MTEESEQDLKAFVKQEKGQVLVLGTKVFDASQLIPSLVNFTRKQYLFLNHYRLGVPLEEAAAKSEMAPETAEKFLEQPKTIEWLQDRAVKDHIRNEWAEGGKWWEMGDKVLSGEKHLAKDQQVVFMAFGERVAPKPRPQEETGKTVINFNFSSEAVKEAFKRQNAIDAELSQ